MPAWALGLRARVSSSISVISVLTKVDNVLV